MACVVLRTPDGEIVATLDPEGYPEDSEILGIADDVPKDNQVFSEELEEWVDNSEVAELIAMDRAQRAIPKPVLDYIEYIEDRVTVLERLVDTLIKNQ